MVVPDTAVTGPKAKPADCVPRESGAAGLGAVVVAGVLKLKPASVGVPLVTVPKLNPLAAVFWVGAAGVEVNPNPVEVVA